MQRDVLLAGGLLFSILLQPRFPMLCGGAVFAGELDARNLGVTHLAFFRRVGGEVLHVGVAKPAAGVTIEDVGFHALAILEGERDIAAIIEGLFERSAQVFFAGQLRHPAFEVFIGAAIDDFNLIHIYGGMLDRLAHARVSSRRAAGAMFSILTK